MMLLKKCLVLLSLAALAACSDPVEPEESDAGDFVVDDIIPNGDTPAPEDTSDSELPDTPQTPDAPDAPDAQDVVQEVEEETIDPDCDKDMDGVLSRECGGDDCDDNSNLVTPGRAERCDELDNNCDEVINEGIDCTFFAHTGDDLYRVDPFLKTATRVTTVPNLFDIDTHPDGTLYGITADSLFRFDDARNEWFLVGSFPEFEDGTGLAIDSQGTAWVTAADAIYTIDLVTTESVLIGRLGGNFFSSGDCVINKEDTLFMTSKAFDVPDTLVLVNRSTGRGTAVGSVGFNNVFGLTAGFGRLYGLNSRGDLIELNRDTGAGTLIHTFEDLRWFGAASSPGR